jgi:F0F1-type ATP synthase membrane subunit c/vacuolar-type H+-ATPase subunit K
MAKKFNDDMTTTEGVRYLSAGLSVGLACLASGWGISLFLKQLNGKATRKVNPSCPAAPSSVSAPETFVDENSPLSEPLVPTSGSVDVYSDTAFKKMVLSMVFLEAIGLYGHIVALMLIA